MLTKLSHPRLWAAIDKLAQAQGLSVSGLAKAAGLDPTSFNKSKRVTAEGRPRWPSTESLARVQALPESFVVNARNRLHQPTPKGDVHNF